MNVDKPAFTKHDIPSDLVFVAVWMILTVAAVYLPVVSDSVVRVIFGLPFLLFIPGYVLIAALFPKREDIDGIERLALSFGLSIAIVPLIGLALNYTPWGIRLDPIAIALLIFTTAMTIAAAYRRLNLPETERFSVEFRSFLSRMKGEFYDPDAPGLDRALSIILLIAIAAAVITTGYVIAVPKEGEKFTEFYILGENGMAADYPIRFNAGDPQSLLIGIGNHEYRDVTYTVETHLFDQTFDPETNRSVIHSMRLLDRFSVTLAHNTTEELSYTFTVDDPAYNRLQFLLFNETVPSDAVTGSDRVETSYRDLHLWLNVRSFI